MTVKPTRATQPYRKGARRPGAALAAMLKGKPGYLPNPQGLKRRMQREAARAQRRRKRRV